MCVRMCVWWGAHSAPDPPPALRGGVWGGGCDSTPRSPMTQAWAGGQTDIFSEETFLWGPPSGTSLPRGPGNRAPRCRAVCSRGTRLRTRRCPHSWVPEGGRGRCSCLGPSGLHHAADSTHGRTCCAPGRGPRRPLADTWPPCGCWPHPVRGAGCPSPEPRPRVCHPLSALHRGPLTPSLRGAAPLCAPFRGPGSPWTAAGTEGLRAPFLIHKG